MEENFNPYLKWLGIPLKNQPPNHYQLLGIPEFMDDADVISNSADRQMGHVRNFATGQYGHLSQKLLNEIAAAKVSLLNPAKKQAYDQQLRSLTSAASPVPQARPLPQAQPVLHTRPLPQATALAGHPSAPELASTEDHSVTRRVKKKSSAGIMLAGVIGLVLVGGVLAWKFSNSATQPPSEPETPSSPPVTIAQTNDQDVKPEESETTAQRVSTTSNSANDGNTSESEIESDTTTEGNNSSNRKEASASDNLLEQIDLERDTVAGDWKLDGDALLSPDDVDVAKLMLPESSVPTEYVLEIEAERLTGGNMLFVGLMIAGKQREFYVDYQQPGQGSVSGFMPPHVFPPRKGPFFQSGQTHLLRFEVTTDRVVVSMDGKTLFDLSDRLEEMIVFGNWSISNPKVLYLGTQRSAYRFTKVKLTPLAEGNDAVAQNLSDKTSVPKIAQQSINLLSQIDVARDTVQGNWRREGQALISPATEELNRLMLPGEIPPEYVLDMEVERVAGDNVLFIGFMVGGRQAKLTFDYHEQGEQASSSFAPKEAFPQHQGALLQQRKKSRIRCEVTNKRVIVSVDGKTIFDLTDRLDELEMPQHWAIPNKQVLFVGSYLASFRFIKVELTPLEKGSTPNGIAQADNPPAKKKTSPSVDLLKQIDVSRDQIIGEWTYDGKALNSPTDVQSARLMLPGEVPAEYVLELEVERVEGDNTLVICFLYKGKQRELFIDWREPQKAPVSGFAPESVAPPLTGAIFENGKLYRIELRVALDRVTVNINGKTLWDIQNQLDDMYVYANWVIKTPDVLYLGTWNSHFRFTKIQLTPLDKNSSTPGQETGGSRTPLAEKLPLPAGPELEAAQKTLSEVFKEDLAAAKSTEQKRAIAQTLLKHATDDTQKPVEKFVLLKAARTVAISGADPATAMKAIDLLDETFVIQPLELKADTLTNLSKSVGTTEEELALITEIGEVVRQMVEAEQFDAAKPLTRLAQNVAIKTRNADLRRKLAASVEEFDELHEAYRKIQPALEKLQNAPDDPEANLAVGRYRAFSQLNWEVGLKHLAAGSDEALSALAKKDLAGTEDSAEQLKLADAWWEAADEETSNLQAGPKIRSAYWYRKALPSLTGLTREKILKRLEEIRELDLSGDIHPEDWELWVFDGTRFQETENAKIHFDSGILSLTNNLGNFLLLVYQPYVSHGPFLATLEIKGDLHAVGLTHVDRSDQSMGSDVPRDEQWHTVTIERLADKSLIVMIDGEQVNIRHWKTDNNLVGKIAIWLQPRQNCSIRRFEVQTPPSK